MEREQNKDKDEKWNIKIISKANSLPFETMTKLIDFWPKLSVLVKKNEGRRYKLPLLGRPGEN